MQLQLRLFEIKNNKRLNISVHVALTFICQIVLIAMSFNELLTNEYWYPNFKVQCNSLILFGRFICSSILHLALQEEVSIGLDMMKYALNHPYKFVSYRSAYLCGLLQCIATLSVEIASIGVICAAIDTIDMIFNFIALSILAEFDNFVYDSLKNESFKELCEKSFYNATTRIQHTTSKKCDASEVSDELDENGEARPLCIFFAKRERCNKVLFVAYKVLRTFYVSVFYYFLPFTAIVISALIPIYYREYSRPVK